MNAQNKSVAWHERRLDFTSEFQEKQKAWFAQCLAVNKTWSQLALLFDAREIVNLDAHQAIQEEVDKVIQVVLEDYFQVETSDMAAMYNLVSSCSARARSGAQELFAQASALQGDLAR